MRTKILASQAKGKKADRLSQKFERFIDAVNRGIQAASEAPSGAVNVADYLDASQVRLLARLAEKGNQTPRQFLQGIVARVTRTSRRQVVNAGGAA
jgi:hypothetical protein